MILAYEIDKIIVGKKTYTLTANESSPRQVKYKITSKLEGEQAKELFMSYNYDATMTMFSLLRDGKPISRHIQSFQ